MAAKKKSEEGRAVPDGVEEAPEQEKDAVRKLLSQIDRAKTLSKSFNETTLPKLRRAQWGAYGSSADNTNARTNLIYATAATMLPHIYAKNPEIAVAPTEAVGDDQYDKVKEFGKTAQVGLNHCLVDEAKMKRRIKSAVRSAMATSVGWLKLSYQHSLSSKDPLILRRANDIQENLRRVEYLIQQSKNETDTATKNQQREELKLQLKSIMDGDEIKVFKGFVIDRVRTEDIAILDESIVDFDEYVNAKKIAHRVWMTDDEYRENFGHNTPTGATSYAQPSIGDITDENGAKVDLGNNSDLKRSYRAVWEVWDHGTNTVCVVCEGCAGYAKKPYLIEDSPERWYPFYAIAFNLVEGRWRPISDTELLLKLQDEYNTTRYLYAEARKEAIPIRVFRKAGSLTEEDITSLTNRKARDWIGIEGNPSIPLAQEILQLEGVKIDPTAYDVTIIRNDMDMMVGLSDASRANLIQAKTATEAEIMRQALMTRVAERQDHVEDVISEMSLSTLQIMLQAFTKDEITQLVGDGAVWPEHADIEQIFRQVRVSVKAGTSGKPNVLKERETWAQILPIINETMTQVAEMRMAGQSDLADAKIELLKETLQRYDERIDVDRFIPRGAKGDAATQQAQQAQQFAQAQEKMQQMAEELQKAQEALQQCQMDLKVAQEAEQARIAEADAQAAIAAAKESSRDAENARQADIKREAELEAVRLKQEAENERRASEFASKTYAVAVQAASSIVSARLEPTTIPGNGDGEPATVKPGEDLTAEEIGDAIATITNRIMKAAPMPGGTVAIPDYVPATDTTRERANNESTLSQTIVSAMEAMTAATAALAQNATLDKRIVLGANGLPERLVVEQGRMQ